MTRTQQLQLEARAYLAEARRELRAAGQNNGYGMAKYALNEIAAARAALHEAAWRYAELQKLADAAGGDDIPF